MNSSRQWLKLTLLLTISVIVLLLPTIFTSGYMINAMIDSLRWIIFALAFDLAAGHVGAVSLGHPIFYGAGAYVAALLAPALGLNFIGGSLLAAALMAGLAILAGLAFFRIRGVTFAIGTLGALIIMQLIALNAYNITKGPLCVKAVARPEFHIPFMKAIFTINQPVEYYYLLLPLLIATIIIYRLITTGRIGRAFVAVREDEIRASAIGIYPKRYKLLALAVGAALIGALGAYQAYYVTVVCPSELSINLVSTLLIIIFVGGIGSMRGVVLGAIIFSALPRVLESGGSHAIPPAYQQIAYGAILVGVMIYMPRGLDGIITQFTNKILKHKVNKAGSNE